MPFNSFPRPGDAGGLKLSDKIALVNAIGSPAKMSDSFQSLISQIGNKKKSATGTAVSTASSGTTVQYANSSTTTTFASFEVTGLSFKPSKIIAMWYNNSTYIYMIEYELNILQGYANSNDAVRLSQYVGNASYSGSSYMFKANYGTCYVNNGGFRLPCYGNNQTYNWIAFE